MAPTKTTGRPPSAKTCKQIAALLVDYLNGRLDPTVQRQFKKHLSICPDCVGFINTYKKTVKSTAALRSDQLPPKVRDNLLSFLRDKLRRVSAVIVYLLCQLAA